MKNYFVIISFICLFLFACIYFRTGYFESSIKKNEITFYFKNGDSIKSKRYYRDLSDNWILLDKKVVITPDSWQTTSLKTN